MDFSQTLPGDSVESDILFVKEELADDNIADIYDNHDASANEECMEVTEEKPVIAEIFQNSATTDIKQETDEGVSSAGTQDFVFVACADNVALNQIKLEDQHQNTTVHDSSDQSTEILCLYCTKKYPLWMKDSHKITCEWKYVYPCSLCPTVFYHKSTIRRHIQLYHSKQLIGSSVEQIFEAIISKRVELNIETPADKIKIVNEIVNNASLRAEINGRPVVANESSSQFIVPDVDILQVTQKKIPTIKLFVMKSSPIVRQQSNVRFNQQNKSVTNEIATKRYVHCNECHYQTVDKEKLRVHMLMNHSVKLNLMAIKCPKCDESFMSLGLMTIHKTNCKIKTFFSCLFCPKILLVKENILRHIRDQHAEKIANKSPKEVADLVEAKKKVVDLSKVSQEEKLEHSVIREAKRRNLHHSFDNDIGIVESDTQPKSNVSSVVTEKKIEIQTPSEKVHHKPNEKSFDERTYKTSNKPILEKNIINDHCDRSHLQVRKCRNCEKNFTGQDDLKTHEAACSIRIYFFCSFCKKVFVRKINAEKHLSQAHPKKIQNLKKDEIDRLVEAGKKTVDISVIEIDKESTKITDTQKESSKIIDTEKKNAKIVDTQKERSKVIETEKKSTKIIDTENKITKPKIQYLVCHHCQFKTRRKDTLVGHIKKKHSAVLGLKQNQTARFNYKCTFCPKIYMRTHKVKLHILQKHSSELSNRPMDEIIKEVFSKRTNVIDLLQSPDKIDASTLDYVLVYCDKCKTLKTTPGTLGSRKNNCRNCGSRIIYVCSKCKNAHALDYMEFRKHWRQCTEVNEISKDYLDKLVVYKCTQCQFCTTHKYKLAMHVARSKHKAAGGESVEASKNEEAVDGLEIYDEDKFAVRPCVVDFSTMTNRYCPKCDKVVTEKMQPRTPNAEGLNCQVCKTRFHAQCVKCNIRRPNWLSMRYHLNTKCYPGDYLCIKCTHRTSSWQLMQKHYVIHHTNRTVPYLCEFCSFRSTHRTNFNFHLKKMHPDKTEHIVFTKEYFVPQKNIDYACDLCSFTSKHKYSLKVHLHTVHSTKKHKCKLCKFKTRYDANLKRHVLTKHKNFY